MKFCAYHKIEEPEENFRRTKTGRLESWCIEGKREYGRNYNKDYYADQKLESEQKRLEYESRTSQKCSACEIEKPIEDFPFRGDRPGKRRSQCHTCWSETVKRRNRSFQENFPEKLKEKRKDYQLRHPGYGGGNARRAALKNVRRERILPSVVRERDNGICFFCAEQVDPEIKHPDRGAGVVHHLHPISKRGADIYKNVAYAHHGCNLDHHAKYDNPFKDWKVEPLVSHSAAKLVVEHHYLHRRPNISFAYGLFENGFIRGVVTFGSPSSWRINLSACPDEPRRVIELNRLWLDDDVPFGAASWFVSRALKQLPARIVVSYSDLSITSEDGRKHTGAVYRALSFHFAGESKPRSEWRFPDKTRNVGKIEGAIQVPVSAKRRFWKVTGSKREKKILSSLCAWESFPYDKST